MICNSIFFKSNHQIAIWFDQITGSSDFGFDLQITFSKQGIKSNHLKLIFWMKNCVKYCTLCLKILCNLLKKLVLWFLSNKIAFQGSLDQFFIIKVIWFDKFLQVIWFDKWFGIWDLTVSDLMIWFDWLFWNWQVIWFEISNRISVSGIVFCISWIFV